MDDTERLDEELLSLRGDVADFRRKFVEQDIVDLQAQVASLSSDLNSLRTTVEALAADRIVLRVPWKKPPSKRRREIILPQSAAPQDARPIRAETRATLVASIAHGRRWLDEIVAGTATVDQIAVREQCSIRQVNMTISLAFLAPRLVQAAVEGRLPRGIGVTRLRDAPAEWGRQFAMLGLSV